MDFNKPIVIFVMGRPGAGKDTVADSLAERFHLIRIITSDLLQAKFKETPSDPETKEEKALFESGALNSPSWVLETVKEHVEKLAQVNFQEKNGITFSGSPRTSYEAEHLVPFLEDIFGSGNMFALALDITEEEGIERILKRAGRALDQDPKKLKIRMEHYDNRTRPVLEYLEKRNLLIHIDGMPSPEEVIQNTLARLEEKTKQ